MVEDFLERPDLEIAIFLAEKTGADDAAVVYTAFEDNDVAQTDRATTIDLGTSSGDPLEGYLLPSDYVGVVIAKTRTEKGKIIYDRTPPTPNPDNITAMAVDGDSLVLESTNNKQSVFVWYGKVHHSSETSTGPIFAAALVHDVSDGQDSPVVLSKESISIDADRTESPNDFVVSNGPATRVFGTTAANLSYIGAEIFEDLNDPATPNDDTDDTPTDTYMDVGGSVVKVGKIGGASLNSDHGVLGIGDTLFLDVTLGGASTVLSGRDDDYQKIVLDIFGKERLIYQRDVLETSRTGGVVNYALVLGEGDFDDFSETRVYHSADPATIDLTTVPPGSPDGVTDTLEFFIVDKAGNRSKPNGEDDDEVGGATAITKLLFDAKKPALDSVKGDTILPVTVDTISDGSRNAGARRIGADEKQMEYNLASTLDSLVIAFDGANDKTVVIEQAGLSINGAKALRAGNTYNVDFTQLGIKQGDADGADTLFISTDGENPFKVEVPAKKEEIGLKTGMHTIKFTGTDVAGNVGPALSRENVYVDVDNINFIRSFPFGSGTEESGLDTLEAKTSVVVFRLSEPADSVAIEYKGIAMGADADSNDVDKSRSYQLVGSQLSNTTSEGKFPIPGLQHDNQYVLQVAARDLAGNWFEGVADTFWYDTSFVVPAAARFCRKIHQAGRRNPPGLDKVKAGEEIGR